MEQLESILKSSPETNSESYRTYNMVIQKGVNGFEAVNCFHKNLNLQTLGKVLKKPLQY